MCRFGHCFPARDVLEYPPFCNPYATAASARIGTSSMYEAQERKKTKSGTCTTANRKEVATDNWRSRSVTRAASNLSGSCQHEVRCHERDQQVVEHYPGASLDADGHRNRFAGDLSMLTVASTGSLVIFRC